MPPTALTLTSNNSPCSRTSPWYVPEGLPATTAAAVMIQGVTAHVLAQEAYPPFPANGTVLVRAARRGDVAAGTDAVRRRYLGPRYGLRAGHDGDRLGVRRQGGADVP
jgi:hypothetical protein